jgi:serine/threonine protein kinase
MQKAFVREWRMFIELAPRTILQNRYRVISRLDINADGKGKGGMGAVYLAEDFHYRRECAVKQTYFGKDADLAKAFRREAALLAHLEHPSLPGVIDYFLEGEDQFLVMKLIRGDDLDDLLSQHGGRLPVEMVLNLAEKLLAVLDYLHSRKPPVIHRDIKPSNLKLTPNGQLMLLDFGIAKGTVGLMTQSDGSINAWTADYAPPEQMEGTGTEARSDLYSFGATFYHLLTGKKPPQALKMRAFQMATGKPDPLQPIHQLNSEVPVEISNIFIQTLSLDIEKRPSSARVLRQKLKGEKVSTGETTIVRERKITFQRKEPSEFREQERKKAQQAIDQLNRAIDTAKKVCMDGDLAESRQAAKNLSEAYKQNKVSLYIDIVPRAEEYHANTFKLAEKAIRQQLAEKRKNLPLLESGRENRIRKLQGSVGELKRDKEKIAREKPNSTLGSFWGAILGVGICLAIHLMAGARIIQHSIILAHPDALPIVGASFMAPFLMAGLVVGLQIAGHRRKLASIQNKITAKEHEIEPLKQGVLDEYNLAKIRVEGELNELERRLEKCRNKQHF